VFVARADGDGALRPAGSVEIGLSGDERERLRAALERRRVRSRGGARRVAAGVWLDIDFHGSDRGPLRDPVMRALQVDDEQLD
jgi:hypothetical protein